MTIFLRFKAFFLIVFTFFTYASGQTFSNTAGASVPDNVTTYIPIQVTGLPTAISMNYGIISVCCNITHPAVGQLDLLIKAPNGTVVKLANNRGGGGKNYTNTCFKEDGTLPIQSGVAPFLGNYIPDESINAFNNGIINPNGTWSFGVLDEIPFSTGRINSATITFGPNPPPNPIITYCTTSNGTGCKCPDGSQDCDLLPDVTDAAKVIQNNYYDDIGYLYIGVGTPNIGYGPLEMRGTGECYCDTVKALDCNAPCPDGSYVKEKVVQRVYHKSGPVITYTDKTAGFMQFHPTHGHVHMDNWTYNSLRMKGPNPNPLTWPIIGKGTKVSFCLVNSYNCSNQLGACTTPNGATLTYEQVGNPGMGTASGCGREQGIFPGYLDIYFPGYDGQIIPLDSNTFCNGYYYVVSEVDPENNVRELNDSNNVSVVPVFLNFQKNGSCCKTAFYADTLQGNAPFTVNFYDTTKPASYKWFWDFGDGTTDTVQFPKHTYTKSGNYTVSLKTIALGTACSDSLSKSSYIRVRKEASADNPFSVNVYPNPFSTLINVIYNLNTSTTVQIAVYDLLGKKVYDSPVYLESSGVFEKKIKLAQLAIGTYFVKTTIGHQVFPTKVLKIN